MITLLSTNIGRGHPFYLDGVRERLAGLPGSPQVHATDVFAESRVVPRAVWAAMRELYRRGGSPGLGGALYRVARGDRPFDPRSLPLRLAGSTLRARFGRGDSPLLVDHPILVAIFQGRPGLAYQHGEVAVPAQAIVPGASRVYVPTRAAADAFVRGGIAAASVVVTGLCVEPALADAAAVAYESRQARLRSGVPLVGGFFSSGAEPPRHVEHLVRAAGSAVEAGGKAIVVAARGGRLAAHARQRLGDRVSLVVFSSRLELDRATEAAFAELDYVVGPPHERTGWALGLGLPMAIVGPDVGPFAPLNRAALLEAGVALAIDDAGGARRFGQWLQRARERGKLEEMSARGFGRLDIDGFGVIARDLASR